MKRLSLLLLTGLVALPLLGQQELATIHRYGLFIGSNEGGRDREQLLYAASDAYGFAGVMAEIGGIPDDRSVVLIDPSVREIDQGFRRIREAVQADRDNAARVEFILYYSGHSDDQGILLGPQIMGYRTLKDKVLGIQADVNIAILDSCSSGSFTRLKGGDRQSPFLLDEGVTATGSAFLTSSSEDEAAQESDSIGGSFFTYYMVTALRGAADKNADGKVSLHEAYDWAAQETKSRTLNTLAGPQNPSYQMNLSGSGELVLTDLRRGRARIEFGTDLDGRIYINDERGRPVSEFMKLPGQELAFTVPPGTYVLSLNDGTQYLEAAFTLGSRDTVQLGVTDFRREALEQTVARGSEEEDWTDEDVAFAFFTPEFMADVSKTAYNMLMSFGGHAREIDGGHFGVMNYVDYNMNGVQMAAVANNVGGDVTGFQGAGIYNITKGNLSGAQMSGVFNLHEGNVESFQSAGVFNITSGDLEGIQLGGIMNMTLGRMSGAQAAGILNFTEDDVYLLQAAGATNFAGGRVSGSQAAGIVNIGSEDVSGFQAAGVLNLAIGGLSGFQIAGVVNRAKYTDGMQIAGVLNLAGNVDGIQVGLVNIGRDVVGTQVGLVNISRNFSGIPIGLINISANGLNRPFGWYDDAGYYFAGYQIGTPNVYTVAYAGVRDIQAPDASAAGIGSGVHFGSKPFFVDADLSFRGYLKGGPDQLMEEPTWSGTAVSTASVALRGSLGLYVFDRLALLLGGSLEGTMPGDALFEELAAGQQGSFMYGNQFEFHPKIFVGVRF